jgi:chorismate mutase/prephenate dehydratase
MPRKKTSRSTAAATARKARLPAPRADLALVRARIDAVDVKIQALINERAQLAQAVGVSKTLAGQTADFYMPEREAQVLRMARARNKGPLRDEEVLRLFREIMSACLAQQEPLKVAFLGPEGTFTQTAVLTHFGHSVRALPLASIDEVFHEVESANADFGVVPIENSTEGTVNHTLDRFLISPLKICGEVELRIHQFLMGRMTSLERIARVCSHQQSLAQCRSWLQDHLPEVSASALRATPRPRAAPAMKTAPQPSRGKRPPRSIILKCWPPTSRIDPTIRRASSCSAGSSLHPAARIARRSWCR